MKLTYLLIALLLIPSSLAIVDVFQGRHSVTATSLIDPGPKGLGGFLSDINTTVQSNSVKLQVSGTWFQDFDRIIIDSILLDHNNEPISGVNCTLSLKDSTFTEILTNTQMAENTIAGEPHYTFNATNISLITSSQETGKFFGHVRCEKDPPKPFVIFSESDFEVHDIQLNVGDITVNNTETINQIIRTQQALASLLDRQFDFSQEEVFLVTDAFNSMSGILEAVENGEISEEAAAQKVKVIEQRLQNNMGGFYKQEMARFAPKAGGSSIISDIFATPKEMLGNSSLKNLLYWFIGLLLVANIIVVIIRRKRQFEEMW